MAQIPDSKVLVSEIVLVDAHLLDAVADEITARSIPIEAALAANPALEAQLAANGCTVRMLVLGAALAHGLTSGH